ncbi:MAG: peroxidase-related enzyme [Gammaproteobacteria bacterium]|nr:peroxidase-related enzyme [Gammaproteobacteria bacterium]
MPFFGFLNADATMIDLWRRHPARLLALGKYTESVMRGPSSLSPAERELIAAYVSGLNQCRYCHGAHKAFAVAHGVDPDLIEIMLTDLDGARVEPKLKPLLRYCRKLTEAPARLTAADVAAARQAGWPEEAIEDAVHVAAIFNFYNRLMDGHGIAPRSDEANRARAAFIKQYGYDFSAYPEAARP